ncbi:hypothetical protein [Anderseniella sp. Alg231-50]|uniref:hypothetical protein n=1 Tax=Anderseniella sp. Alg231-50 TaxID=1922226 RepID=UPI000D554EFF
MKRLAILAVPMLLSIPAQAEQQSRVMPLEQVKSILEATKDSWVAYRIYSGRQYYYVTHLLSWRCGIKQVRYSENSDALDKTWPLPECNKLIPNTIPDDAKIHNKPGKIGSIKTLAIQLEFDDGSTTPVRIYEPCEGVGEATCGYLKEER